jgi:hypothetical protein
MPVKLCTESVDVALGNMDYLSVSFDQSIQCVHCVCLTSGPAKRARLSGHSGIGIRRASVAPPNTAVAAFATVPKRTPENRDPPRQHTQPPTPTTTTNTQVSHSPQQCRALWGWLSGKLLRHLATIFRNSNVLWLVTPKGGTHVPAPGVCIR